MYVLLSHCFVSSRVVSALNSMNDYVSRSMSKTIVMRNVKIEALKHWHKMPAYV